MDALAPRDLLLELSSVSEQINAVSDALSKTIAEVDGYLQRLGLGVESEDEEVIDVGGNQVRLAYAQDSENPAWSLCARFYQEAGYAGCSTRRLVDTSRDIRIALAPRIPVLLERLVDDARSKTKTIQDVLKSLGKQIPQLSASKPGIIRKQTARTAAAADTRAEQYDGGYDAPPAPGEQIPF